MMAFFEKQWRITVAILAVVLLYYFDYRAISLGLAITMIVIVSLDYILNKKEDPNN